MQVDEYFNRPSNMTYHNLCTTLHPPQGIGSTLGLGLKFCIQSDRAPDFVEKSINRFSEDVRKKYLFAGSVPKETPKKIYIKSSWIPDPTPEHVEDRMSTFARALSAKHNFLTKNLGKSSNLTSLQKSQINLLRSNRDFVILISDKNLGPAIMERELYIKNILNEHLLDGKTYSQIDEKEGNEILEFVETETKKLLHEYNKYTSEDEMRYFKRGFAKNKRIPQFYGLPKVHKEKLPMPFRPVVSQCGSVFSVLSTFIDYVLQSSTNSIPSYTLNSTSLLDDIDSLGPLPPSARLFTSDATSMYSNIHPEEALPILKAYLDEFGDELDYNCKKRFELILKLTELVMTHNVFKFGSTWWRQLIGTAMGTSCACIYATIFFAYFERKILLPKYKKNFLLYKRKIDDILGVWKTDPDNPNAWEEFKDDLNKVSHLEWNTDELAGKVHFLDLNLWIDGNSNKILYSTYQKPMNLFLYIPKHSASPPGLLKSLVFGLIGTYKRQNSSAGDFNLNVKKLFERLLAQGYKKEILIEAFDEVTSKLETNTSAESKCPPHPNPNSNSNSNSKSENNSTNNTNRNNNESRLFFHLPFHPRGVSRRFIQQSYKDICEKPDELGESFRELSTEQGARMSITKLTVAYSRPKNLRDVLAPSALQEFEDCAVQQFIPNP